MKIMGLADMSQLMIEVKVGERQQIDRVHCAIAPRISKNKLHTYRVMEHYFCRDKLT